MTAAGTLPYRGCVMLLPRLKTWRFRVRAIASTSGSCRLAKQGAHVKWLGTNGASDKKNGYGRAPLVSGMMVWARC